MPIAEYLSIGGPPAVVLAILGFLVNAYLNKRKDDREEVRLGRESESGIVETTREAIKLARDEMTAMHGTLQNERREHAEEVRALTQENVSLKVKNHQLEMELAGYRGWSR